MGRTAYPQRRRADQAFASCDTVICRARTQGLEEVINLHRAMFDNDLRTGFRDFPAGLQRHLTLYQPA